jgi:hypothetical protein
MRFAQAITVSPKLKEIWEGFTNEPFPLKIDQDRTSISQKSRNQEAEAKPERCATNEPRKRYYRKKEAADETTYS